MRVMSQSFFMTTVPAIVSVWLTTTACIFIPPAAAQLNGGDWPLYNRDLAGTRYSPLTQIDPANVHELDEVWRYSLGANLTTGQLGGGSEFTPLVVDGTMYVAASDRVVGLDAGSGEELWRVMFASAPPSRRGLGYWPGDDETAPRIFVTSSWSLVGIDVQTQQAIVRRIPSAYLGAPIVFNDIVIVGSNTPPGSISAYDARTLEPRWTFHSVPAPGEFGHDTWESDAWRDQANLFHWAFSLTLDTDRGLIYAAFESPGPNDYYGGDRPGDNLFGDSIVAIDVETGEYRWHFQTVHHDLWDFDLPAAPGLLDVEINGEVVPLLASASKTGYLYVLNRETGEPVFGIEEVPVPQSNVPSERSALTQPIPIKPPPLAQVSFTPDDIVSADDTTEEHAQFCRDLYERSGGLENHGPFTPYRYREPGSTAASTIVFPGSIGGANWGGTAADPELGYFFVNVMDEGSIGWIEDDPSEMGSYRRNSIFGPLTRFSWSETSEDSLGNVFAGGEAAWPCNKPPWARLIAVNAATGDIVWAVPLGITDALPADKQKTGRLGVGGPIATASGLIFIGATNDRRFRAFSASSGEELWVTELDMSAIAVPITYATESGKQYVAVVAAAASALDDPNPDAQQALVVFALPNGAAQEDSR
jgi:glucose dehydrogenase